MALYDYRMKTLAAALSLLLFVCGPAVAGKAISRPVVVEIYTSQGCDSCVLATSLSAKLAKEPGLIVLNFAVTYWDMFGWKDTLANEDNTRRQKAYAAALHRGGVYTPQMIVDGVYDVPAAKNDAVAATLARVQGLHQKAVAHRKSAADSWQVDLALAQKRGLLHLTVGAAPVPGAQATIWLFKVRSRAVVHIGGGENKGRTVVYNNVVTGIEALASWHGEALTLDVPLPSGKAADHDMLVAVVQQGGTGRIVGAAKLNTAPLLIGSGR